MQRPRPSTLACVPHADGNVLRNQFARELLAGELHTLVAVENLRPSSPQGAPQSLDTKVDSHRQR
jgi:hypothetical protein